MSLLVIESQKRNPWKLLLVLLQIDQKLALVLIVRDLCLFDFSLFFDVCCFNLYEGAQLLHQMPTSFHIRHNWGQFGHIKRRQNLIILIIQLLAAFFNQFISQMTPPL